MRNIRIPSLMVVNLSCVAQTGLESMLPIATPQNLFQQTARVFHPSKLKPLEDTMTTEQKIIRAKVGLLELAKQLGNVSQACEAAILELRLAAHRAGCAQKPR